MPTTKTACFAKDQWDLIRCCKKSFHAMVDSII